MQLYCGIGLHSNNSVVSLSNDTDQLISEKRLENDLETIGEHLKPYQDDIDGVVVESTFSWYWLVDGLMEKGYPVDLANTVLTAQNQNKVKEIVDFVGGLDRRTTHTISMVRGNLLDNGYKQVDPENYRCAAEMLATRLRGRTSGIHRFRGARLKAAQDVLQCRYIHRTLIGQDRSLPCYAGRLNLVLTESGEVYPCEIIPQSLGNVRDHDYDIMLVARTEKAMDILHSISTSNAHCRICTHECNYITNILF